MVEQFRRYFTDTIGHTDILNICCNLGTGCNNPIFPQDTPLMMLYYQTKFGCKPTSSLEDTTEIEIFWFYKPSLWPWHWTQWTIFSARHFGLWCYITIPGLTTKCSVVQKILSWRSFTNIFNLCCDIDLEVNAVIPFSHRTLQLMMLYHQATFNCKQTSSLEDIVKNSHILIM